ncbi:MAG: DUF2062 domain-containing protein [Gammaproteobacteria bacterium]|nr:DUF2062 domain-containing protein [Gammaproteobacteria bacterium]
MPKKLIKKYLPHPDKIKGHKNLQFLGERLHEPNLWHLNRRSVALAFAIGLFTAWIPVPGQMAIAAVGAFYFRANLPLSVALVWITNPFTMPPMFYFAYRVGLLLMARKPHDDVEFTFENAMAELGDIWAPFLLGCLVIGTISSAAGYFGMSNLWRYHVGKRWIKRQKR